MFGNIFGPKTTTPPEPSGYANGMTQVTPTFEGGNIAMEPSEKSGILLNDNALKIEEVLQDKAKVGKQLNYTETNDFLGASVTPPVPTEVQNQISIEPGSPISFGEENSTVEVVDAPTQEEATEVPAPAESLFQPEITVQADAPIATESLETSETPVVLDAPEAPAQPEITVQADAPIATESLETSEEALSSSPLFSNNESTPETSEEELSSFANMSDKSESTADVVETPSSLFASISSESNSDTADTEEEGEKETGSMDIVTARDAVHERTTILRQEKTQLDQEIVDIQTKITQLDTELETAKTSYEENLRDLEKKKEQIAHSTKQHTDNSEHVEELIRVLNEAKNDAEKTQQAQYKKQIEGLEVSLSKIQDILNNIQGKAEAVQTSEIDPLKKSYEAEKKAKETEKKNLNTEKVEKEKQVKTINEIINLMADTITAQEKKRTTEIARQQRKRRESIVHENDKKKEVAEKEKQEEKEKEVEKEEKESEKKA